MPTQKSLNQRLAFTNLHQHRKNYFIQSSNSWDTANFRVLWAKLATLSFEYVHTKYFYQLLIDVNLHQHPKIRLFHWLVWRHGWLKNPAVWLAKNILAHVAGTRLSKVWHLSRNTANNISFHYRTNSVKHNAKFFNEFKKPYFWPYFGHFFQFFVQKNVSR